MFRPRRSLVIPILAAIVVPAFGNAAEECAIDPEAGYWEVEYDLAGTEFEARNTPLGAGDSVHVVGPGTATIRFEADGLGSSGNVLEGGTAEFVHLELKQVFTLHSRFFGLTATVDTEMESRIPDRRWNRNPFGRIDSAFRAGILNGTTLTFADPALPDYHAASTVLCRGNGCRLGGLPNGEAFSVERRTPIASTEHVTFGPGGPAAGAGWKSDEIELASNGMADSFLRLRGTERSRTLVSRGPGRGCEVAGDRDRLADETPGPVGLGPPPALLQR